MDSYNQLLQQIQNNVILQNNLTKMIDEYKENTLNLACSDWEQCLRNDKIFQDIQHDTKQMFRKVSINSTNMNLNYEVLKIDFNILLVGVCRFLKPFKDQENNKTAIIVCDSPPLNEIATALTSDLESVHVLEEYKFNFNICSIAACSNCKDAYHICKNRGVVIKKIHQPCIYDTKIFDGKFVLNMFTSQMEESFPQSFLALLKLKIENRYDFDGPDGIRNHRIGGKVLDMIAFHESKLLPLKRINLGESFIDNSEVKDIEIHGEKRKLPENEITEVFPKGFKKDRNHVSFHEEDDLVFLKKLD